VKPRGSRPRSGTANTWLCRFFTWFWFARENREDSWPRQVVQVLGPSTFLVDRNGSRQKVWLREPGCYGYEYPRQIFILIGEWLYRFDWFRHWNRPCCSNCWHDKFVQSYHDTMNNMTCEYVDDCAKCHEMMYQFSYGAYQAFVTNKWLYYEELLF